MITHRHTCLHAPALWSAHGQHASWCDGACAFDAQVDNLVVVKSDSAVKVAVVVRPLLDFEARNGDRATLEVHHPNRVCG